MLEIACLVEEPSTASLPDSCAAADDEHRLIALDQYITGKMFLGSG